MQVGDASLQRERPPINRPKQSSIAIAYARTQVHVFMQTPETCAAMFRTFAKLDAICTHNKQTCTAGNAVLAGM